jgi:hypothetical protein
LGKILSLSSDYRAPRRTPARDGSHGTVEFARANGVLLSARIFVPHKSTAGIDRKGLIEAVRLRVINIQDLQRNGVNLGNDPGTRWALLGSMQLVNAVKEYRTAFDRRWTERLEPRYRELRPGNRVSSMGLHSMPQVSVEPLPTLPGANIRTRRKVIEVVDHGRDLIQLPAPRHPLLTPMHQPPDAHRQVLHIQRHVQQRLRPRKHLKLRPRQPRCQLVLIKLPQLPERQRAQPRIHPGIMPRIPVLKLQRPRHHGVLITRTHTSLLPTQPTIRTALLPHRAPPYTQLPHILHLLTHTQIPQDKLRQHTPLPLIPMHKHIRNMPIAMHPPTAMQRLVRAQQLADQLPHEDLRDLHVLLGVGLDEVLERAIVRVRPVGDAGVVAAGVGVVGRGEELDDVRVRERELVGEGVHGERLEGGFFAHEEGKGGGLENQRGAALYAGAEVCDVQVAGAFGVVEGVFRGDVGIVVGVHFGVGLCVGLLILVVTESLGRGAVGAMGGVILARQAERALSRIERTRRRGQGKGLFECQRGSRRFVYWRLQLEHLSRLRQGRWKGRDAVLPGRHRRR